MNDFNINILGCGSALPTTRHMPSSQVIDIRGKLYMIDCGEGTQIQLRKMRLKFNKISHIFISHLHGDHCFGLPGLISTLGLLGRNGDLFIHAPKELENYLQVTMDTFCKGLDFEVKFNPIDTTKHELIMEDRSMAVYSIPLKHRIPTCGFLFKEKPKEVHINKEMVDFYHVPVKCMKDLKAGLDFITEEGEIIPNNILTTPADPTRCYAYCSDTSYTPSIIPYIKGVDLLYHEATFSESDVYRAKETFHSTAKQAATIALKAQVKKLLIGHYSARYENTTTLLEEAKSVFPFTDTAYEGMKLEL